MRLHLYRPASQERGVSRSSFVVRRSSIVHRPRSAFCLLPCYRVACATHSALVSTTYPVSAEVMMPRTPRIGIQIGPGDPFWVQVREVLSQRALTIAADLVEVDFQRQGLLSPDEHAEVIE